MRKTKGRSCRSETRKKKKYSLKIPDRKLILEVINKANFALSLENIMESLSLDTKYKHSLLKRINAMERDGQLIINRKNEYSVLDESKLFEGRVIGHPRGFGFLDCFLKDMKDIFLSTCEMTKVFDGDIVMVRIVGLDRKGRPKGIVERVVERKTSQLVGQFFLNEGSAFVKPDNPRISRNILIQCKRIDEALIGQIVVVNVNYAPFFEFSTHRTDSRNSW